MCPSLEGEVVQTYITDLDFDGHLHNFVPRTSGYFMVDSCSSQI